VNFSDFFQFYFVNSAICTCGSEIMLRILIQVLQSAVEGTTTMASARGALKQPFVQCTKCGRTNAAEARFCDWCGTKVTAVNTAG